MAEPTISKAIWLSASECIIQAWLGMRGKLDQPSESERFRMEQGQEIGALARELYPDGVMVTSSEERSAAEMTQELIADGSRETLFEAAFANGPLRAKVDILRRQTSGWHVLEVKSSFVDTDKLDEFTDDLAYTVMVLRRSGLPVHRASLVLLSREYRFGDDVEMLFEIVDRTSEIDQKVADAEAVADEVVATLTGAAQPAAVLVGACKGCPFFSIECLGVGVKHSVLDLPRLHPSKVKQLGADGIVDMSDLPKSFKLTDLQRRALDSALSGEMFVGPDLRAALDGISWPCHYLDFETVATFLPLYPERRCHEQVLTQFSIHHCDSPGNVTGYDEYLADPTTDCERELAIQLIEALGDDGDVIMYSSFEKTRVKGLVKRLPGLSDRLQAIIDRFVNLLGLVSKHVYHPEFRGSFSIKSVQPALVPDQSYEELDIRDGDTAITRFARMTRGEITGGDVGATRRKLLEYCKQDTLVMLRLHERLEELCC